jgi:IS4 transposase
LQAQRQPAVLACAIRGKTGGTRALCKGRKSYRTTYTFTDGTVAYVAMVATLPRGRDGRRLRKWLMFVLVELDWSPRTCKSRYRRRFGIECSYRQGRQVRIITNSMNPALRFFCLGLTLVLVNVWVSLRWTFARQLGRGPRRVDPDRFRFHRFVHFLMRAIEHAFGVIMSIPTHRSPQFVIY